MGGGLARMGGHVVEFAWECGQRISTNKSSLREERLNDIVPTELQNIEAMYAAL